MTDTATSGRRAPKRRAGIATGEKADLAYDADCTLCPRLAGFLAETHARYPTYWSRPVAPFGDPKARILIVGLAPGMHGANRTGRPFTGDHAGILLYETLHELGLGSRSVSIAADDPLRLRNARITNAVKCLPPQNKPLPDEIRRCNVYLRNELMRSTQVRVIVALGRIAHDAVLIALDVRSKDFPFAHAGEHRLSETRWLIDSYHCSRYNTQTRRLTAPMFKSVLRRACQLAER
jgi:uracil-DNA glycosylase family 4